MDNEYASHEDVKAIIQAVGESTAAISNLALKLEHQSELIEASEKRNDKRIERLESEAKEDRKTSAQSRKEMHKEITGLGQRLVPVEGLSDIIKGIATKIIGSLVTVFIIGGIGMFAAIKLIG